LAGLFANIPVRIAEEIGFPNHGLGFRLIFKFIYFFSHKVVAISSAVQEFICDLKEVSIDKVVVIYNPVSSPLASNSSSSGDSSLVESLIQCKEKPFIFITTCRLVTVKNLFFLIKVFNKFVNAEKNPNVFLWIIGDGPLSNQLKTFTYQLDIFDQVIFLGHQSDVFPFLKEADVFILPSSSEGFSISLVEAMLCKLVVVSTNVGGPSEIVSSGINGFLFNPTDEFQLFKFMGEVYYMDPVDKEKFGKAAHSRASQFSLNNYGNNLLRLYMNLLSQ